MQELPIIPNKKMRDTLQNPTTEKIAKVFGMSGILRTIPICSTPCSELLQGRDMQSDMREEIELHRKTLYRVAEILIPEYQAGNEWSEVQISTPNLSELRVIAQNLAGVIDFLNP